MNIVRASTNKAEVVHGITNLTADQADAAHIAALVRGHWSIENSVHHVRDLTYREDASPRPHR